MAKTKSTAPRCGNSDLTQSIEGKIEVDGALRSAWAYGTHTTCLACDHRVKFRVRGTDTPPWARIMPHRTDGTPCR